jgi:hypothetical protein
MYFITCCVVKVPMMIQRLRALQEKSQQAAANRPSERPFLNIGCSPLRPTNNGNDPLYMESTELRRVQSSSKNLSCTASTVDLKTAETAVVEKNCDEPSLECSMKRLHSVIEEDDGTNEMRSPTILSPKRARMNVCITPTADDSTKNEDSGSQAVEVMPLGEPPHSAGFDTPKHDLSGLGRSFSSSLSGINRSNSLSQLGSVCRTSGINRSGNSSPRWSNRRDNVSKYIVIMPLYVTYLVFDLVIGCVDGCDQLCVT